MSAISDSETMKPDFNFSLIRIFYLFLFYFYIYPPDSQESDGGANT